MTEAQAASGEGYSEAGLIALLGTASGSTPAAMMDAVRSCVRGIIDRALEKQPANRFQSGHEMADAIRRCMAASTSAPRPFFLRKERPALP